MYYLMSIELYNNLYKNKKFIQKYGETYQSYIISSIPTLSSNLRYLIRNSEDAQGSLNFLNLKNIDFTHDYFYFKTMKEDNLKKND